MGLLEQNKAERRRRILSAARRLIGARGYDGLTMRELARASRVSVPTLYNLFGCKDAILAAEMQDTFAAVARELQSSVRGDCIDRAFALYDAGFRQLLEAPAYYRELVGVFLTARETDDLRRRIDALYVAAMADNLRAGQAAGVLAAWIDAELLARQLYADYLMVFLGWAKGDVADDAVRPTAYFGLCTALLGVASGDARRRLHDRALAAQRELTRR